MRYHCSLNNSSWRDFLGYVCLGSIYYSSMKPAPDVTPVSVQYCRKHMSAGLLFDSKSRVPDNQVRRRQQRGQKCLAWRLRAPRAPGGPQEAPRLVSWGGTQIFFFGRIFFFFPLEASKCFSRVDSTPVWTVLAVNLEPNYLSTRLGFCTSVTCLNRWISGIFGGILKHEGWVAQLELVKTAERGRRPRAVLTEWICFDLDEQVLGCVSKSFKSHRLPQLTRWMWHPMTWPSRRAQQAN